MGSVTSKNATNAISEALVQVANTQMTNADAKVQVSDNITISGTCNFRGNVVNQSENFTLNENVFSSANFQTQVSQQISQQIDQIAEAISQSLTLNPGSTTAQNIANAIAKNKTTIANNFLQSFYTTYSGSNSLSCSGGTVQGNQFNQSISDQLIINATNLANSTSGVSQEIEQAVSQSAVAKQEDSLIFLAIIIVAIVVAIVGTGGEVLTQLTKPQFLATIAPLAIGIGYLIFAYSASIWPLASCQ